MRGGRWGDESGATMVEYGLVVLFVAILTLAIVQVLGLSVADMFESVLDAF